MKIKWLNVILMVGSLLFITTMLGSVGVPNGVVMLFSFFYGILFPLKLTEVKVESKPDGN